MTHFCPDGLLVRTPPSKPREGLLGFVLRVSETNGYQSPWHMLSLAGISQRQMTTTTLPIDQLASIIGRPAEELARLPWQRRPNGEPVPPMNRGAPRLLKQLSPRHPKICPQCVAEHGIVDAAWDLRIMLACPTHGIPLIDKCPACRGKLSWFRQGLGRCRCGHIFATDASNAVPSHAADLLQVVYDSLHGLPTNPSPESGIPASDLYQLGIDDLLMLLGQLAHFLQPQGRATTQGNVTYDLDLVVRLSGILSDWPKPFQQFLETIDPDPSTTKIGLARRFGNFYGTVIAAKKIPKEKMLFLRKAVGQYASLNELTSGPDPRFFLTPTEWAKLRQEGVSASQLRSLADASAPVTTVNVTELSRRLGVRPITARGWAERGIFGIAPQPNVARGLKLYKVPEQLPGKGTSISLRERAAGKYLGLPVSLLRCLHRDGYYRITELGGSLSAYSQCDLDALRKSFLAICPQIISVVPENHITLSDVFRMKFNGVENKYRVLRSILDGTITPVGRLGEEISNLILASESLRAFREDTSTLASMSASTAAKIIDCCEGVVTGLVELTLLEGNYHGNVLHVTTQSIDAFRAKYISCNRVAKNMGSSSRRVTRLLTERGVALLSVPRKYHNSPQAFSEKDDVEFVIKELSVIFRQNSPRKNQ